MSGTVMTLRSAKSFDVSQEQVPQCNKETVGKMRLQKWTRGILAIVNSGGHIIYWSPLYKSEGPAQVAVIVLNFLFSVLAPKIPEEEWNEIGNILIPNMLHSPTRAFSFSSIL